MSATLIDPDAGLTITTNEKVGIVLWPQSRTMSAKFGHLSVRQRRDIYQAFKALIEACAPDWPRHTDFIRVRNAQAAKYGVDQYVILRVFNHLRWVHRDERT